MEMLSCATSLDPRSYITRNWKELASRGRAVNNASALFTYYRVTDHLGDYLLLTKLGIVLLVGGLLL